QRIAPHQVDVVGDQHQGAAWEVAAHAARGIRDDQDLNAQLCKYPRRQRGYRRGMTLIEMKTPRLHEHGDSLQASRDQLTLVPGDARLRKTGNGRVGNVNGIGDLVGEKAEPRSEHDRHAGFELAKSLHNRGGGRGDCARRFGHSRIPASVADKKFASIPAIMARNPSRARSCLRSGASAPMPPISMPTALTLANPHSAKVAMVSDTGSSCARSGARYFYAMNVLS